MRSESIAEKHESTARSEMAYRGARIASIDSVVMQVQSWQSERGLGTMVVGVIGERRGVGNTSIARQLAMQATGFGLGDVLYVEGGRDEPKLESSSSMGSKEGLGLVDHLNGKIELEACIHKRPDLGISVLSWGGDCATKDLAVGPILYQQVFQELRTRFSWVVVDLPVMTDVETVPACASQVDGVIVVVDNRKSTATNVRGVLEGMGTLHIPVLGCVMNRYALPLPRWISRWL
ncbi:MAG: tyrosine-protein kinase family protein [Pirellula sp.]